MSNAEKAGVAGTAKPPANFRPKKPQLTTNQKIFGALIVTVQEALAAYTAAFTAFSDAKLSSNCIYAEQMRPGDPEDAGDRGWFRP